MDSDRFTVRKQWLIPWKKKLKCWFRFDCVSVKFENERVRNVANMITIFLLLLITGVTYIGYENKQNIGETVARQLILRNCKVHGYDDSSSMTYTDVRLNSIDFNACGLYSMPVDWDQYERNGSNHGSAVIRDKTLLWRFSKETICDMVEDEVRKLNESYFDESEMVAVVFLVRKDKCINKYSSGKKNVVVKPFSRSGKTVSVVLKETLGGWKDGQRGYAPEGGLEKFLVFEVFMAVLNGSFILTVVKNTEVLTNDLILKNTGSKFMAVVLLAIHQTMAVVYAVKELKDRWVSRRMTVSTPNWFKGLLLSVSRW